MKNTLYLGLLSIILISCGGIQNASEDAVLSETLGIINEAEFIQEYMGFRKEVLQKASEVKTRLDEDRLSEDEYDELRIAYNQTRETFNGILNGIVMDLVVNIDQLAKKENEFKDKYTNSFKNGIEESKSTDEFLGLFAMYDDTDSAVLAALVSIAGPAVLKGIRRFVRNSRKFESFTRAKLSPPVIAKFGFPEFEEL